MPPGTVVLTKEEKARIAEEERLAKEEQDRIDEEEERKKRRKPTKFPCEGELSPPSNHHLIFSS